MESFLQLLGITSSIPAPAGPYKTIGVVPFRFPGSTFAKIFYPGCEEDKDHLRHPQVVEGKQRIHDFYGYNTKSSGPYRYTREQVVKGLGKWTNMSQRVFTYTVGYIQVHYKFLLRPREGSFPVVVFSHGMGGNADIYSKFCSDIASHGYIVIPLEHEDGSASYAFDVTTNEEIYFVSRPKEIPYSEERSFRKSFLEKRTHECETILKFLLSLEDNLLAEDHDESFFKLYPDLEKAVFTKMNLDKLFLAGHSFGAASCVILANHLYNKKSPDPLQKIIKGVALLDLWPSVIEPSVRDEGLRMPVISILSQQFRDNVESKEINEFLQNSNCKLSTYMKATTHPQFSDTPWFTKRKYFKRKTQLEGSVSGDVSQVSITEAVRQFLKDSESFSYASLGSTLLRTYADRSNSNLAAYKPWL